MLGEGLRAGLGFLGITSRVACYIEREAAAAAQLVALMEAECLDAAPIWSDLTTFDGRAWRGAVDCILGGFPCQPWSAAGAKKGTDDARWIWPDIARIISEIEPEFCFFENVPGLVSGGGLEYVLFDLARLGFDAECAPLSAAAVGAAHKREREFILAFRAGGGFRIGGESSGCGGFAHRGDEELGDAARRGRNENGDNLEERSRAGTRGCGMAHASGAGFQGRKQPATHEPDGRTDGRTERESCRSIAEFRNDELFAPGPADSRWPDILRERPWLAPATQPGVCGVVDGLALVVDESRRDQLREIGNGCVPLCVAAAFVQLVRRAEGVIA